MQIHSSLTAILSSMHRGRLRELSTQHQHTCTELTSRGITICPEEGSGRVQLWEWRTNLVDPGDVQAALTDVKGVSTKRCDETTNELSIWVCQIVDGPRLRLKPPYDGVSVSGGS